MIFVLSPAKSMNEEAAPHGSSERPFFLEESEKLLRVLKKKKPAKIKALMKVSDAIANLNYERYQRFEIPYSDEASKIAINYFDGDVYKNILTESWSEEDYEYSQSCCRILSGFYGLLKPLDRILAYRLEMGVALKTRRGSNLYSFWGDRITKRLNEELKGEPLVNLASGEYFKAINSKKLKSPVVNIQFKENRDGSLKMIGFNAKRARGMMADFIIRERIKTLHEIKSFQTQGYSFLPELSDESNYLFVR